MNITAGKFKGRKVIAPDENITRPTLAKAREAIFSVLFSIIDFEGKSFLDTFAGSGIMGLEAISRGFESVCAIEKHPKIAKILKENYKSLDVNVDFHMGDSLKTLPKLNKKFEVIYIDPPYMSGIYEKCLELIKSHNIADENSIIVLEHITQIDWEKYGFKLLKQKNYSQKLITFLEYS